MTHVDLCTAAAAELEQVSLSKAPSVLVGFDGFVDNIIDIVDKRKSTTEYTRIATIAQYGARISAVAGNSTNLERVLKQQKLGGNGPIMANAILGHDMDLTYIGILGDGGAINPIFSSLAERAKRVINLGHPCTTDAYEFDDGKIMMTLSQFLDQVNYDTLVDHVGKDTLKQVFSGLDGLAMVNWTMTIEMTDVWRKLAEEVLPGLYPDDQQPYCFIDFCDPAKRTSEDLCEALAVLKLLNKYVNVILGMNEEESRQILEVLGGTWRKDLDELERAEHAAKEVQRLSGLNNVVSHFVKVAACADAHGSAAVQGFYTPKPKLTTGAGDNFNAGFFTGKIYGLSQSACLLSGTGTSGFYVRNAQSPTLPELKDFLANWTEE